jgi:hypothetical protein
MKAAIYLMLFLVILTVNIQGQSTYYIRPSGDDMKDGKSPETAWKTIERANKNTFKTGEKLLLEGGFTYQGTIHLDSADGGTKGNPLLISKFGDGIAIIEANDNRGLYAYNCAGIRVSNLTFRGSGVGKNNASGIEFFIDFTNKSLYHIEIDSCEVSGFHQYGILIHGDKSDTSGFRNVRITNCLAYENGEAGIGSFSRYPSIAHKDFYLAYNKAFNNRGILSKTENHSGNGIVMGGVENIIIEYCEAYENGADNRCEAGGPVGIWLWTCKKGVIQDCESHHNYAGLTKDGGGFDIDGGSSDCIIRNCFSHDNEGAGYLLAQFDCPIKFKNNTITNNISRNDGRKNNYGSIAIWGANANNKVMNCEISNNKCFVGKKNMVSGTPSTVRLIGTNFQGIKVINNTFEIGTDAYFINAEAAFSTKTIDFQGNTYKTENKQRLFVWGKHQLNTLNEWKKVAAGQEIKP